MASADRLIEIFNEAKARPAGAERDHFLSEACRDEPALKKQVLSLLQAHEAAGDFLKNQQATPPITVLTEKPGDKIGRYKLLEQIGEGGCGVVYMAEQEEPVRRRVAFKVIKLGMDTKDVVARFEAEGQALALMDHPNIAKVFDAGATNTGRPYFVMELVRGIKITDYCDQNNLPTGERLKLFTQVCHAIQHAHQKGIIHRDIKPSNILVTVNDGVPVPKVIDFGIAKAIEQRLTDKTVFTAFDQFIGTPAYMSPEQAEMTSLDIDTRADIYSLGVLLYELLSGNTPFDAEKLVASGVAEIRRIIREQEPPKPSTRLKTLNDADLSTVAQRRHTDPPKLLHLICGDLDWIVMKCLEKDRVRRYETANGLARDIQRHLDNEAITARPPSNLYRFQKLARRNKFAFGAIAAVATALLLGAIVSSWQALRATRAEYEQIRLREEADAGKKQAQTEAAKSEEVALFMKDMLKGVGPGVARGRDTKLLREILDQTAGRLDKLKAQPAVEADLRDTLGVVYRDLGEYTNAAAMHLQALALRKKLFGEEHPSVAFTLNNLGLVLHRQRKYAEAEKVYREALTMQRKLLVNESTEVAITLNNLGSILRMQEKLPEAETMLRAALAMRRKLLGNENTEVAESLGNIGLLLRMQGLNAGEVEKLVESEAQLREALAMRKRLLGVNDPSVAGSFYELGRTLELQDRLPEAETALREAVAIYKKLLGYRYSDVSKCFIALADVLMNQKKYAETESMLREGAENGNAFAQCKLGYMYASGDFVAKDPVEAAKWCRKAVESDDSRNLNILAWYLATSVDADVGDGPNAVAIAERAVALTGRKDDSTLDTLAIAYAKAGQFEKAINVQKEAIALLPGNEQNKDYAYRLKLYEADTPYQDIEVLADRAYSLLAAGGFAKAESVARQCLAIQEERFPNDWRTFNTQSMLLGGSLLGQHKYADAEPLLIAGYEGMKQREDKISVFSKQHLKEALQRLVQLYEATGQSEKATEWNRKLAEFDKAEAEKRTASPKP